MSTNQQQGPFWDFVNGLDTGAGTGAGAGVDHQAAAQFPFGAFFNPAPPGAGPAGGHPHHHPCHHGNESFAGPYGGSGPFGPGFPFGPHHFGGPRGCGGRGGRDRRGRHNRRDGSHERSSSQEDTSGTETGDGEGVGEAGEAKEGSQHGRKDHGHHGHRGPHGPDATNAHGMHGGRHGRHGRRGGRGGPRGGPFPGAAGGFDLSALFQSLSGHPLAQAFTSFAQQAQQTANQGQRSGETFVPEQNDESDFVPPVDVFSTPSSYILHVALAGAKKGDVGVNWDAEKSVLNIAGVVYRQGDEEFLKSLSQSERKVGVFERTIKLPPGNEEKEEVNGDAITAKLEDGVLIVTVPKLEKEWTEVKRIDIL